MRPGGPPHRPGRPPRGCSRPRQSVSGYLSTKRAETSYWAVTDGAGKAWEIVNPNVDARRRLQNSRVTLRVERKGGVVFEQVRVLDVVQP